jgi:hypothetical protein
MIFSEKEMEDMIISKRANFINQEIKDLFWITLVTCPDCSAIHSSYDSENVPHPNFPKNKWWIDCRCGNWFFHQDAPDLFY